MNKKVLICFVLLAITGASFVFAQAPTLDKLSVVGNTGNASVNAANKQISGDVIIPDAINGRTVTNIQNFENCTGITSVTIPVSLISINSIGFKGCTNLTSVTFLGSTVNIVSDTSFPGDLRAKYRAGGAGVYTRSSESNTWTRTGNAPPPAPVINLSLDGVWQNSSGGQITVSGSTGVWNSFGSPSVLMQDAINRGYTKAGDQYLRNIRSTGNLTWSGELRGITSNTSNPNVATGAEYRNCTITMNANGQSLDITTPGGTVSLTRR